MGISGATFPYLGQESDEFHDLLESVPLLTVMVKLLLTGEDPLTTRVTQNPGETRGQRVKQVKGLMSNPKGVVTNYGEWGATKQEGGGAREVIPLQKGGRKKF